MIPQLDQQFKDNTDFWIKEHQIRLIRLEEEKLRLYGMIIDLIEANNDLLFLLRKKGILN